MIELEPKFEPKFYGVTIPIIPIIHSGWAEELVEQFYERAKTTEQCCTFRTYCLIRNILARMYCPLVFKR